MPSYRIEKVNDQLRAEISELIGRHMKDPRLAGLISVTGVDTTPDLRRAKVFISVLGSDEERAGTMAALRHAAGFFRHELRERLRMKRTPELELRLDRSIEHGDHIMRLLRQVQSGESSGQVSLDDGAGSSDIEGDSGEGDSGGAKGDRTGG